MEVKICFQWGFALCGFHRICMLHFFQPDTWFYREYWLSRSLECIVLDHYAFCIGQCYCQKFYAGEQGPFAILLYYSKSAGNNIVENHLQRVINVVVKYIGPACLLAFLYQYHWRSTFLLSISIIRKYQFLNGFYDDLSHRIQGRQ